LGANDHLNELLMGYKFVLLFYLKKGPKFQNFAFGRNIEFLVVMCVFFFVFIELLVVFIGFP
jgi:hypothetical protein